MKMVDSDSNHKGSYRAGKISVSVAAVLVVFIMVTTSFAMVLATSNDYDPNVWTDKDEYCQGETVCIYGEGFARWTEVEIELSHSDFGVKLFTATPDYYGRFMCDDYVAELVTHNESVVVTVTQVLADETLVATTEFWDPAAYMEGFTLAPHRKFTKGDIKGWFEGDSIPFIVGLDKAQLGGDPEVTVWLSFDFCDHNSPVTPVYGIDFLTEYWDPNVNPPFNTLPPSSSPFKPDDGQGVLSNVEELPHGWAEGGVQELMLWKFTFTFADGVDHATIRFGAHLARTSDAAGYDPVGLGAGFYPGAALHVNLYDLDPSANEGDLDVPISTVGILIPPEMTLDKCCTPGQVAMGDEITFVIEWSNIGWATASCVVLTDDLPYVVDLDENSFLHWTSEDPTKYPVGDVVVTDNHFEWDIAFWRGTGLGGSDPPLVGYLEFKATVNTNEEGTYCNVATLTYTDDHGGYYPPVIASCCFCIVGEPEIDIEKSGPMYAHVGDVVTYSYTITNTGPVALTDVDAYDDVAGTVVEDDSLAVSETKTYFVDYEILETDPDHLVNCVDVIGEDAYGRTATDSDCWEIDILHPEIDVTKVVQPECAEIGEEVVYTITVSNPSIDTNLYNVVVDDSLLGVLYTGDLLAGETKVFVEALVIDDTHGDPLINTVTAVGEDLLGLEVSDEDCAIVEIYHPMVEITKEADLRCAEPGETITYWITVTNPSWDTDLTRAIVSDLMFGDPIYDGPIAYGETIYLGPYYYVVPQDVEEVYNIATVDAWDVQGHYVTDFAIWTVEIFHPAIEIYKWSEWRCAEEGEVVEYWIEVSNPSWDATMDAEVYDPMLGGLLWTGSLAPGEVVYLGPFPYTIPVDTEWVVNLAYVEAWDHQLHYRYAEASWTIEIFHPAIEIYKWSEWVCAEEGELVEYWIDVYNPSWDATMYAEVYDPMLGGLLWTGYLAPLTGMTLGPFPYVIPYDTEMVVNLAYVEAWDHQFHYVYAESCWTIEIFHPMIAIDKWSEWVCAEEGEVVEYWIEVSNPSWDATMTATVYDPLLSPDPLWSGDLAPGTSHLLGPLPYVIPAQTEWVRNIAYVVAFDHQLHEVYAEDYWEIEIFHPAIEIFKWSEWRCAEEGERVEYFIDVYNPSWDATMHAEVYDPMLGGLLWSGSLAPGEVVYLGPFSYVIPEDVEWVINLAYVEAWDHQFHYVYAESSWTIEIFHPAIEIFKWSEWVCAEEGERVEYFIDVWNPSWDATMYVEVHDPMLGGLLWSGYLAPGEIVYLGPFWYTIPMDVEWVVNLAYVDAWDHQFHYVYAESIWEIEIFHPAIEIFKWSEWRCAEEGEVVEYYIDVSNPSWDATMYAEVYDPMLGGLLWSGSLAPGEVVYLGPFPYTIPMDTEWVVNLAYVEAWDHQFHYVYAESSWTIEIFHPAIEILKWSEWRCAEEGERVEYFIDVYNPSWDATMYAEVYDPMLGGLLWSGYLAPGEIVYLGPFPYVIPEDVEWVINLAYVDAWDHQWHYVYAESSWDIEIFHPAIEIFKWSEWVCAEEGERVEYFIDVWNPSWDATMYAEVYDPMLGGLLWTGYLAPGEIVYLGPFWYTIPMDVEWVVNLAYVDAWDHQWHYVYAESSWEIEIFHPMIGIQKWSDWVCAEEGEIVYYDIEVWNPSWDATMYAEVYDPMLAPGILWSGELAPGERIMLGPFEYMVPHDTEWVINTAWVEAWDHQWHYVFAESTWEIEIFHPMIEIAKWEAREFTCAHEGEQVNYYIQVSNPSWDATMYAEAYDPMLGGLLWSGYLAPGEWVLLGPYAYIVPEGVEWVVNLAYVDAWDHQFHYRYAESTWTIEILYPDIEVTKVGPESASIGETITYYVNVTNTGDTELFDVTVMDSLVGPIAGPLTLGIGETVYLSYDFVVPPGEGTLDNLVTVEGRDRQFVWVDDEARWTVYKYGEITGFKTADLNLNAVWDEGEPGLINWVIKLTGELVGGGWDNRTTLTDTDGYYEFTDLSAGVYTVSEVMQAGWTAITVTSYTVTVGSGTVLSRSFGNIPYGCICGYKWFDSNMNGIWDEGEDPIPGWTIFIYGEDVSGHVVDYMTETDENGMYCFCELLPGLYSVYEELREGWIPTTPPSVLVDVSAIEPFEILLNFGNVKYGQITGYKWLDEWMNGIWDGHEVAIEGWTIELTGVLTDGSLFGPVYTTTDENGFYCFCDLLPGTYIVREIIPAGWTHITPDQYEVTLEMGDEVFCAKFGNVEYGMIDGWKFVDWDMDGFFDGVEEGLEGWQITLEGWLNDGVPPYSLDGTYVGPFVTYTDENGYWYFDNLLPGIYKVTEESRPGWYATTPMERWIIVTSGSYIFDVKFGNVPYTCLWGYKFEDINGDGRWLMGEEPGLPGWTIVVEGVQNDGVPVYIELVTDVEGYWATCFNILPGEYWIYEIPQEGWVATTPDAYLFCIPMAMGPMDYEFLFGNFKLGKICGYKYEDMNGNGVLDEGDVPIAGWGMYLSGAASAATETDADGYFCFDGLMYGEYTVTEESRPGWAATTPTSHTVMILSGTEICLPVFLNLEYSIIWGYKFEDKNSNGVWDEGEDPIRDWQITMMWNGDFTQYVTYTDENGYYEFTGLLPSDYYYVWEETPAGWTWTTTPYEEFMLVSGSNYRVHDFGNFKNVDIWVFKFEDVNSNGVYDEGDRPLEGWEIMVSGPGVPGGTVMLMTGPDGWASVEVTAAGMYEVVEMLPPGWTPTTPIMEMVSVESGCCTPCEVMFGNFRDVTITLFKYEDMNSNGVYDNGDEPIPGWEFYFENEAGTESFTVTTGMDGTVSVTFDSSDLWTITEEMPEGWVPINPASGMAHVLILSNYAYSMDMQMECYYYEFGNFRCVDILIFKYWDKCSNGWYDPDFGDEPLPRWYFELRDVTGAVLDSGYTDENGELMFTVCRAGVYYVVEEDREGWTHIDPASGYFEIEVESGDSMISLWFANYLDVDIPIFKYEDRNSNGEYDEGDVPIPDWYFEMTREGDGTVYSGYTDENGELVLTVNRSGVYTLVEEMREGWTPINPASGARLLSITSGTEVPVQMFGNFRDVTIWIFKFEDVNSNGEYDEGDRPLEGWSFTVTGPWSGSGAVVTTGPDGFASIVVDRAGIYTVTEEDRAGWTHTTPPMWDIFVWSSMQEEPLMFGNFKNVDITVFKFEDVNSNGVYDEGVDVPLEGWMMMLYTEFHGEVFYAFTDATGHATFTLTYSDYVYVYEDLPIDWVQTCPGAGSYEFWVYSGSTFSVLEFGNFHCVWIEVFKYEDVNSNGVYDDGDRPVEGWHFYLYDPTGMPCGEAVTDVTGTAWFRVCHAGVWIVEEEMREHVTPINPATGWLEVEVWSSATPEPLMFGNFWDVLIIVFKYEDMNSNGVYDNGDVPIPDWMFEISGPGVMNAVEYTDGTGHAYFWVNRAGTYTVTEEDREGWTHVNPADGDLDVTVMSGCMPEPLMFGNFEDVIIIIFKFDDRYADGQYCPIEGDAPLEGWVFELYILVGEDWVLVATATTDAEGYAQFVLTQAGVYKVVEVLQTGWFIILPVGGEYIVEVMSGDEPIWLYFANFKLGKIFGWKWNDLNGNGEWDEGEPGLPGWTIHFECWFWVGEVMYYLYGEDVTDENGYYEFTGLPPGTYHVWEDLKDGWVPTSPTDVDVVIIGHTEARVDFLNFELGCVWGYKYEDYNGNGVLDDGDMPLAGWHIYLYLYDGLIATTMTDGDGYYSFCGLGPGVYTVVEESRAGWIATNAPSEIFAMTSGASIRVHDFLNFELGIITGYKFEDLNSNGEWDEGEPAIEGWLIFLALETDPPVSEYTDWDGSYEFAGLMAGTYTVWEDDVEGWTHTTPCKYVVEIYSGSRIEVYPFGNFRNVTIELFKYEDVDGNGRYNEGDRPIPGWMFTVTGPCFPTPLVVLTDENGEAVVWITMAGTYVITEEDREGWMHVNPESGTVTVYVLSGDMFEPFMFGNFKLGEITGQKFYDWNLNGIKDEGEIGLANWVIWINGTLVGGGYLNFTLLTDSEGFYGVAGLPAGVYVVSERLEFAPAGWVPTTPTAVTVDITSASAESVSFANAVFGIIEGYKFYDKDQDGVWDEGEPGLAGWIIILEGVTDEGVPIYRTTTTDGAGYFLFEEVQPGVYEVTEELPPNWAPTTPLPVTVNANDVMEYFEFTVYIGNIRFAKVFGYKFLDTIPDCYPYWPNGIFDEYEYGLSDWEITLQGWTETGEYVSMVRYTDEFGYYEFVDLLPGTYWINETLLWGWYASRPVSNMVIIFPYPAGMVIFRIDFGNVLPEPDPEVPFVLEKGWNLWSTPIVVDGLTASGLLDAIGPNGLAVTMLDSAQKKYESYVAGMSLERDFPIVSGLGYFVYVTADTAFTLKGGFESQPKADLESGWNLIGYSSLRPVMASELLEMVDGSYGLALTRYNADTGQYESYIAGFSSERDFVVTPGNAYYIWVGGTCELVFG